jgi:hypothetical protein
MAAWPLLRLFKYRTLHLRIRYPSIALARTTGSSAQYSILTHLVMATSTIVATSTRYDPRPIRRQYSTCHQCRYSRKACNGGATNLTSCSTCLRKGKKCTYVWLEKRCSAPKPYESKRKSWNLRHGRRHGFNVAGDFIASSSSPFDNDPVLSFPVKSDETRAGSTPTWLTTSTGSKLPIKRRGDLSVESLQRCVDSRKSDSAPNSRGYHIPRETGLRYSIDGRPSAWDLADGHLAAETMRLSVADAFVNFYENSLEKCLFAVATPTSSPYNDMTKSSLRSARHSLGRYAALAYYYRVGRMDRMISSLRID